MTEDESNKAGGAHAAGGQSPSFSVTKQRSNGGISFPKNLGFTFKPPALHLNMTA